MLRLNLCLVLTACFIAGGVAAPLAAADKLPIAVLNMDRIYKTHQPLLDQLAPIKADADKAERSRQQRAIELASWISP